MAVGIQTREWYRTFFKYSEELERFLTKFKRPPPDFKYWPYGPYWPHNYKNVVLETTRHIRTPPPFEEPLWTELEYDVPANKSVDTQQTPYTGNWRGIQIVFDSEKSARDYAQPRVPEGCCPSLTFESRFECGNLRQARRVGQFEYELVLKTDLYTKRHTQWYYFRVKSMVPGVVYKLRIANLLKRDSLYNHGMRPLLYSETKAASEGIGWYRTGHNISYYRNDKHVQCPLLHRELIYYELEFEIEFPHGEDTCYLAHCYPYTFTDLKDDLDLLISDPERSRVVKREVMCETRAGNSCFLLTVTNFDKDDFEKKAVIITARVHPGESNASWMMKGVIDFITSSNSVAKQLRNKFIFKIVPMLNIDGVIVGNYRCSLGARDLNRNYRHPRRESFPTVWHTKAMMAEVALKNEILIYCDLHGHSRKSNVFMYGCSNPENAANMKAFLQERMLPWLMSNKASGKFFFNSCKFHIRRCKEATGRVVMYRQYSISNSFTMEATFSGTAITHHNPRHFNQSDFMEMGDVFCQVVLEYEQLQQNKSKQSEIILELTRELTHQILESRGMLPQQLPLLSPRGGAVENGSGEDAKKQGFQKITDAIVAMITKEERADQSAKSKKPAFPSDINLRDTDEKDVAKMNVDELIENMTSDTIDGCIHLLEQLKVNELVNESESSDSDSESDDPEVPPVKEPKPKKKKKRKSKKQKESFHRPKNLTPEVIPESRKKTKSVVEFDRPKSAALPAIHTPRNSADEVKRSKKQLNPLQAPSSASSARPVKVKSGPLFINRYEGRSNGGIPCFSQERCSERAAKRMSDMRKRMEEERQKESYYLSEEARYKRYMALTHTMQMQKYQTQEDIRQTFHSAMYEGPIKTHYHHGGDLSPRLLAVGSPVSPNGIKQFEASESDSLSGFDSDHHNPPGAGSAAPLPLSALSTPYTNRCTTPPPPLIPVPVYQPHQQLITDVDPQVTK
ncbi:cytosolic carboxypeptidase 2 [Lingula anatina]|uniref:Cytosolic carboxypeptidase 2 n=1 Tax=Lingula anatina TaxID=7574 RepID=A0A1S3JRI0_LINAN|nr:cytosolic carboxypeptidase 2 [Lingula anatina]|eukprot:XP_013412947.1 cytosolic carboxypeptidase 2 [Lingula anatina]